MHYEIDPDKSHLEEIGVGLFGGRFGRGYDNEEVSWKGAFQDQVIILGLIRQFVTAHLSKFHPRAGRMYYEVHI